MTGPIKPDDLVDLKTSMIPQEVFDAFNELIARAWDGRTATVTQSAVVGLIRVKMGLDNTVAIYAKKLLDIEESYRAAGYNVIYEKPCIGDRDFEPYFKFTKKQ